MAQPPHIVNEVSHRNLYDLGHSHTLSGYRELVRSGQGVLTSAIIWTNSNKTQKMREVIIGRDPSGAVATITKKQYDAAGTLVETLVYTLVRDVQLRVSSISITRS